MVRWFIVSFVVFLRYLIFFLFFIDFEWFRINEILMGGCGVWLLMGIFIVFICIMMKIGFMFFFRMVVWFVLVIREIGLFWELVVVVVKDVIYMLIIMLKMMRVFFLNFCGLICCKWVVCGVEVFFIGGNFLRFV